MTVNYSDDELMAILLSREVRDGEVSACGALSHIPAAGLLLAQALHALALQYPGYAESIRDRQLERAAIRFARLGSPGMSTIGA